MEQMDITEGLNPEQLAAVNHETGPQLVIAGAGTGKTQVITRRIARLIADRRVQPRQILALTFTEKAAREMQERLYELIGWESFQVPVLTFNAFGAELLARFSSHIGRSVRGGLINEIQKTLLLQQHIDRISLEYYGPQNDMYEFLEGVVGYIGQLQNAGVTAAAYSEYVAQLRRNPGDMHPASIREQADLARIYVLYEELKVESGTYDYNDQLALPLQILRQRPNIAERLSAQYTHVLVDEYQDTNTVQDALLRTFVGASGNIFAVGDDDQAIYGFRGAEIHNILGFAEHYHVERPIVLVRNYRSGQAVLDAAYHLIQHNNPHRLEERLGIDKRLIALHDESTVQFMPYASSADEQVGVLESIIQRIDAGQAPGSIGVLAATHAPLKQLAKTMDRRGIPYAISTAVSIFDQPELIGIWYLLKWLVWEASEEAIGHVILGSYIGWSSDEYRELLEMSREQLITVEEALRRGDNDTWRQLATKLDTWRAWSNELPVSQLAFSLVFETGLAERWQKRAETSPRMVRVFEDLQRLLSQMQDFESVALSPNVSSYMSSFPKPPALEVSEAVGDEEGVQLLTVHASKGLEFDTVFLINCTQRTWSASSRAMAREVPVELDTASDLPPDHEFRRLMYVAITRAKQALIISAPVAGTSGSKQMISPFIAEMVAGSGERVQTVQAQAKSAGNEKLLNKLQRFYPLREEFHSTRLPFEDEGGWLSLSVTALGAYEYCPFEFYIENVLKIAQPMGPSLSFGSALHRMFELYYKGVMAGKPLEASELHRLLEDTWDTRGYSDAAAATADLVLAHTTLDTFLNREQSTPRIIVGSEVPVRFDVSEARLHLRGKIDVLFERLDGLEIRDFKTGRTKTDADKLSKSAKTNFQLRTYALACEQLRGSAPAAVVLDYVVTMIEGEAVLTPAILRNHRDKLAEMADRIRQRDFAPNPSPMHQCAAIRYYGIGEQEESGE
jgi:DNA helicase-2/ATP-dependent DNA helicase PcrA